MTSVLWRSAQHEAVGGQQPAPQQQRTFLAAPERRKLVGAGQRAVGVLQDVGDGKIVGESGPDQRKRGGGDREEAGDAGAARGLRQALGSDAGTSANRKLAQGEGAGEQSVGTEREGEKQGEATKDWHRPCVDCRKARRDAPIREWMGLPLESVRSREVRRPDQAVWQ